MHNIYYIGGSPCSGKSTIAEMLTKAYDLHYFKVDDHLDRYISLGAANGSHVCARAQEMCPDETWMRDPEVQCRDELQIYEDIFPFILDDLNSIESEKPIITEGAAFLPKIMKKHSVPENRYLSITPTPEFQIIHYSKREWVPYVLEGCRDKDAAFSNWMNRDILFAERVRMQCAEEYYLSIVNNGQFSVNALFVQVSAHFGLNERDSQ